MRRFTHAAYEEALTLSNTIPQQQFATRMVTAHPSGLDPAIRRWATESILFSWSYPYIMDVWVTPVGPHKDMISVEVSTTAKSSQPRIFKHVDDALDFTTPFLRLDSDPPTR